METNYRYVSALTGVASIVLFLPCIFKEFSTQEKAVNGDGNAGDDTVQGNCPISSQVCQANGTCTGTLRLLFIHRNIF